MTSRMAMQAGRQAARLFGSMAGSSLRAAGRPFAAAAAATVRSGVRPVPLAARRLAGWRSYATVVAAASDAAEPQPMSYPYGPAKVSLEPAKVAALGVKAGAPEEQAVDLLVLGVWEEAFESPDEKSSAIKSEELKALDAKLGGVLADIVSLHAFKGAAGSSQTMRCGVAGGPRFVTLCGMGKAEKAKVEADWGASPFTSFGACIAAAAKANKAKTAAVALVGSPLSEADAAAAAGKMAGGVVNGAYESTRFKSKQAPATTLDNVDLLFGGDAAAAAIARARALALGALLTRYLVEAPPNVCTPTHLAHAAAEIAASAPEVMQLEVLEKADCEKLGMGLYLGVAEASAEPPKFVHLTYTPKGEVKKKVAIVGKGVTFDSGGYNLKAGAGSMIEMMKFDMGGSGATLGAAKALAALQPEGVEVHFLIAACENMVDARGLRPGDILVASNGKTVEINNTDAEGRLTLADAMLFAQNQCGVEAIVDIATLTGACMIALGDGVAGMWASSDEMAAGVAAAAKTAGEKVWRMPLEESYAEQLKSSIADMKNTGGRMGGAITAALFLKDFVKTDKVQWCHIDIAGPAWRDKDGGATGFGAQLLAEWAVAQGR
ncbi:aminopeptidase family isoform B [Micractinium conductrix]|uniref:Aminopeptidase family isoform B n=1 Tax=Micractinium conductrix TaxID=554055 RepID=A0A2P6VRL7_9CHLO|nr:aminopeptidase family isoform B [Micractinium conductrix]|eukprot:PSC76746.1 aminopeptidase family isoform B [Micractinium conductrix]